MNAHRVLKALAIVMVGCAAGCTPNMAEQAPAAAPVQKKVSRASTEGVSLTATLPSGRVCRYSSLDREAADYYSRLTGGISASDAGEAGQLRVTGGVQAQPEQTEILQVAPGALCHSHKECPSGHACLAIPIDEWMRKNQVVIAAGAERSIAVCTNIANLACSSDLDCPDYEKCFGGHCAMCKADRDCRYGYRCQGGICQPKTGKPLCRTAAECGGGEICAFGKCMSLCGDVFDEGTCGELEVCQARSGFGLCVGRHAGSLYDIEDCLADDDVMLSKACVGKEIVDICKTDQDCQEGRCIDGRCALCTDDRACPQGLHCIDHVCGCLSDADCGTGFCSVTHECLACRDSQDCPGSQKCGYSLTWRSGEESFEFRCLECMRHADCGGDKPVCDPSGKCVQAECFSDAACCHAEKCKDHICADGRWPAKDGYSVEEIIHSETAYASLMQNVWSTEFCTKDDECNHIWSACNRKLHVCKVILPDGKLPLEELKNYSNEWMTHFCWRDSECPQGLVCNHSGICGCSEDSCGKGFACSEKFGCIPKDRQACGKLEYINYQCRCTQDAQCGDQKFCASNGACESLKDGRALYMEGLRWYQEYHGRSADEEKAYQYLESAAKLGNQDAMFKMANIYQALYDDHDARYDEDMHLKYLNLLDKNKNPDGMYLLAMHDIRRSLDDMDLDDNESLALETKGIKKLHQAAAAGSKRAMAELAERYSEGNAVPENIAKARRYARRYFMYHPKSSRTEEADRQLWDIWYRISEE